MDGQFPVTACNYYFQVNQLRAAITDIERALRSPAISGRDFENFSEQEDLLKVSIVLLFNLQINGYYGNRSLTTFCSLMFLFWLSW